MKRETFSNGDIRICEATWCVRINPSEKTAVWCDPPEVPSVGSPQGSAEKPCLGCGGDFPIWERIAKGSVGIYNLLMAQKKIPESVLSYRSSVCDDCPSGQNDRGLCNACGCIIPLKIRSKTEQCPKKHWLTHAD